MLHPITRHLGRCLAFLLLTIGCAQAAWVATPWAPLAQEVRALASHNNGTGTGILVGGRAFSGNGATGRGLVRLDAATLVQDASFAADVTIGTGPGATAGEVHAIAVESMGAIVIGGHFDHVNGVARSNIARLLPDGTLDASYDPGANNTVKALAMQAGDSVIAGGAFTQIGGAPANYLARIDGAGARDASFAEAGFDNQVQALALQADDRVVVGGFFNQSHGQPRQGVVRLAADGSADATFSTDPAVTGWVNALHIQPDGQILIGGLLSSVGGQAKDGLARLHANGSLDTGFTVDADGSVYGFAWQGNGLVVVVGSFGAVDGVPLHEVARIDTGYRSGLPSVAPALDPSLTDVQPSLGGFTVYCVYSRGLDDVLIGGAFSRVDQQDRLGLAQIVDAPGVPLAPIITQAQAGSGQATLALAPPATLPASPITGYDVTCTPLGPGAPVSAANAASPVTLAGMANGTPYACTARARNALGAGPAAAAPSYVTPMASATPTPVSTLSEGAMVLLALACAALGARWLGRAQRYR